MHRFIVAEVSKSWHVTTHATDLLSMQFEAVININYERGYTLKDWKMFSVQNGNTFTETIIAIFEKISTEQ